MYRILGADGREYGPVTAGQLRQWIAQGRANADTKAAVEGSAEWKTLGSLPEFSHWFAIGAPAPGAPAFPRSATVRKTHSLAVAGMILGIASLTVGLCCDGLPFNIIGVICSVVALVQIGSNPQMYDGRGMAVAGLVLSILSLLLAAFMIVFSLAAEHGYRH